MTEPQTNRSSAYIGPFAVLAPKDARAAATQCRRRSRAGQAAQAALGTATMETWKYASSVTT